MFPSPRRPRGGFTLFEMMVAVALSVFIVTGLYGLFTVQSRQFLLQDARMAMHQNVRFATDIITRSGRIAGYGSGGGSNGVFGWDGSTLADGNVMPAIVTYNNWSGGGHDAITFMYADPSLEMASTPLVVEPCATETVSFDMTTRNYSSLITSYAAGEVLMCWDLANQQGVISYLWQSAGEGNATTGEIGVVNNSGTYSDYDTVCPTSENLPPTLSCSKGHIITFYIDDAADGVGPGSEEHPVLMMDLNMDWPDTDDVPLVDDIEDLQFAYCLGNTNCGATASWVNDRDLTAAEGQDVWMVRLSIVAHSPRLDPQNVYTATRPMLEDHEPGTDTDRYYREVLTTMVTPRNMRM